MWTFYLALKIRLRNNAYLWRAHINYRAMQDGMRQPEDLMSPFAISSYLGLPYSRKSFNYPLLNNFINKTLLLTWIYQIPAKINIYRLIDSQVILSMHPVLIRPQTIYLFSRRRVSDLMNGANLAPGADPLFQTAKTAGRCHLSEPRRGWQLCKHVNQDCKNFFPTLSPAVFALSAISHVKP